jgi:curved DNA-binding protein CbpA
MPRPGDAQPEADPYRLLGVARQATSAEIAQAWRRRARAEHPDARPRDVGAPARFRALAQAYEVLSDPRRRAAYDQAAQVTEPDSRAPRPAAGTTIRVIVISSPGQPPDAAPATEHVAPLRAGPVRVEPPDPPAARRTVPGPHAQMFLLAQAAARWLEDGPERPW